MSTALTRYSRQFTAKKPFFSFLGRTFRLFGTDGSLQFYVKMKAFRLKEEIVVYADEGQTQPMLRIKARSVLDFGATYDVTDANSGEKVGACRRAGLKSILRDTWLLLDSNDQEFGKAEEDSVAMALVRRFLGNGLIPQTFHVKDSSGGALGVISQSWNPFILNYNIDYTADTKGTLDPRLGVALMVLLMAIEGRQQ